MIGTVESDGERSARAAGRALEAWIGRDHIVGQNPAVAPAAHAHAIRIGNAHRDHAFDAGFQVFNFVMAPVRKDRPRVFLAATRAAAIIHRQHRISVRREYLTLDTERMLVLSVWPTVNAQQERDPGSFDITDRVRQQAVNVRAVFALETHLFRLADLKFIHQRIVLMGKRFELQFAAGDTG